MEEATTTMAHRFPHAGERTTIAPALVIKSPAFPVQYPSIRNIDLINAGALRAMEESWARGAFPERDIEIFRIRGAYLCEECLILDDDLRVIENASDPYTDEEIEPVIQRVHDQLQADRLPHYRGPGVVSKRRAAGNFGHFMMEMLPMGIIGSAYCADGPDTMFLLHRAPTPVLDAVLRAYRLLGVPLNRLHIIGGLEPAHFEELVIVRGLTQHGTYMSPLCVETVSRLAEHVAPGPHKRIVVRRIAGWQRGRNLINEGELCDRLARQGYHPIEPGSMALEDQIAAFSGAEHVVGASGAGMTGIVFCKPGTRVTSVVGPHFPDTFFWFIATHRRLAYSEIRGEVPDPNDFNQKADFRICEADIRWQEGLADQAPAQLAAPQPIVAYIEGRGDVSGGFEEWIGVPGSGTAIDGFAISPLPDGTPIEYRAVVGRNWLTPWMRSGAFCGCRGMALPLFGIAVRAPPGYESLVSATFTDGTRVEHVVGEGICSSPGGAALEAIRLVAQKGRGG